MNSECIMCICFFPSTVIAIQNVHLKQVSSKLENVLRQWYLQL